MRSRPSVSLLRTLGVVAFLGLVFGPAVFVAGAVPGQDANLPSSTAAGDTLSSAQTQTLLGKLKDALDAKGMPSDWIDELTNDLPGVKFSDDIGDNQALYYPAWNTVYLKPGMNLTTLTSQQIATITHEMWHAWLDFIPTYPFSTVSRFSDAQDEAIGGFIDELVGGGNMVAAATRAISEATGMDRGGTAQDAMDAIIALENHWGGSFFSNPFPDAAALNRWVTARRVTPEIQALESCFSEADRARIQKRVDELAQAANEPPPDDAAAATGTTPATTPATGAGPSTTPATGSGGGAAGATPTSPGATSTGGTPAPAPPPTTGGQSSTPVAPVCDPCVPLAAELAKAQARLEELKAESAKVDARRAALRGGEIPNAQKELDQLNAEYDRKLGDPSAEDIGKRGTFISDGTQEVRYQEAGGQVNIVTIRGGAVVSGRRSPYMTNLMARRDAAKAKLERLQAEAARLDARRKELDGELAKAQAAVDAARQKLEDCLKRCGYTGTVNQYMQMGQNPMGQSTGGLIRGGGFLRVGKNLFDLISPTGFSAVGPDGVPYSIARPGLPVDDRYQLFVVMSEQVRSEPPARPPLRQGAMVQERPRLAGISRRVGEGLMAALGLTAPWRDARLASANRLEPGTLVRVAAAPQAAAAPGVTVTATGASSGAAFTIEVLGPAGEPIQVLAPDGLVLQPVRQGTGPRGASAGGGLSASMTGFCLDYHKPPPPLGMVYQVAPESIQQRYRSMRSILRAGRALKDAGLLHPDSDAEGYATFVQQWALWTRLEGWNFNQFANEFLDRTRRNTENAGVRWTDVMRDTIRNSARNRFDDILAVLLEARGD